MNKKMQPSDGTSISEVLRAWYRRDWEQGTRGACRSKLGLGLGLPAESLKIPWDTGRSVDEN